MLLFFLGFLLFVLDSVLDYFFLCILGKFNRELDRNDLVMVFLLILLRFFVDLVNFFVFFLLMNVFLIWCDIFLYYLFLWLCFIMMVVVEDSILFLLDDIVKFWIEIMRVMFWWFVKFSYKGIGMFLICEFLEINWVFDFMLYII